MRNIHVFRSGRSESSMQPEPTPEAGFYGGYPHNGSDKQSGGLTLLFGAGAQTKRSEFRVWIGPAEFGKLAIEMIEASPQEARKAFLLALLKDTER